MKNSRHIHTLSLTDTDTLIHMCRTWVWTTMSYWSDEDMKTFLKKRLCKDCKLKNVERIGACIYIYMYRYMYVDVHV